MKKTFLERVSAVYMAAYKLNSNPDLDGEPCCAAFQVARQLLIDRYGADVGAHVNDAILYDGEYSPEDLSNALDVGLDRARECNDRRWDQ